MSIKTAITAEELRQRKAEIESSMTFAKSTQASATVATLARELEVVELALIGLRKSELNND